MITEEERSELSIREQYVRLRNVSDYDQWEFDRQQNIIDAIQGQVKAGAYEGDPLGEETALQRQYEAEGIQRRIIDSNLQTEEVNDAVDAIDAAWVAENPPPKPTP